MIPINGYVVGLLCMFSCAYVHSAWWNNWKDFKKTVVGETKKIVESPITKNIIADTKKAANIAVKETTKAASVVAAEAKKVLDTKVAKDIGAGITKTADVVAQEAKKAAESQAAKDILAGAKKTTDSAIKEAKKALDTKIAKDIGAGITKAADVVAQEAKKVGETKLAKDIGAGITKAADVVAQETTTIAKQAYETVRPITKIFEKEVINPVVAEGEKFFNDYKDCINVVALASEWAAKKAAYEGANGILMVARELADSDLLTGMENAALIASLIGLDVGALSADGLSKVMEGVGAIIGGGFNVTSVAFDVQAKELAQGVLPKLMIKGIFLGKPCALTFKFDANNPVDSMNAVVKELIKLVPGV